MGSGPSTSGGPQIPHVPPPKRHPYDQWSPDARALDLVGDKWTLLIVRDLVSGPRRFVELQRVLPGISTEQLRSRLNRMVADGMLTRKRYREVPPRVDYELTERARELAPVLGELARWGYEWAWGPPRTAESVDIGAIFRLIPGLVGQGWSPTGSVELTVSDGREGEPASYSDHLDRDGREPRPRATAGRADARMRGTVDGLGPGPLARWASAAACASPVTPRWPTRCSMACSRSVSADRLTQTPPRPASAASRARAGGDRAGPDLRRTARRPASRRPPPLLLRVLRGRDVRELRRSGRSGCPAAAPPSTPGCRGAAAKSARCSPRWSRRPERRCCCSPSSAGRSCRGTCRRRRRRRGSASHSGGG